MAKLTQSQRRPSASREPTRTFRARGSEFEVAQRYSLIKGVGKGAYGVVCSCRDTTAGSKVAIKKIIGTFDNDEDAKRTLREIKLLRLLEHHNIVNLLDLQPPASRAELDDVYEMTELMDSDLHRIIQSDQPITDEHFRYFMYQLFCALKYLHSANVWHRDLKPSNLLVNRDCDLKLCDFGLARFVGSSQADDAAESVLSPSERRPRRRSSEIGLPLPTSSATTVEDGTKPPLTDNVVTRWYRAPELILTRSLYDDSIDIWGAGCILAELLGRKPIFPGRAFVDQLHAICRVIGKPDKRDLRHVESGRARTYAQSMDYKPVPFEKLYPDADPEALDLLRATLAFDPAKRITAAKALEHPYFERYHDPADEPDCEKDLGAEFVFEKSTVSESVTVWKERIWDEILHFHPEASGVEPDPEPVPVPVPAAGPEPEPEPAAAADSDQIKELLHEYKQAKKDALAAPGEQSLQSAYREKKRQYKRAKDAAQSPPEQEPVGAARRSSFPAVSAAASIASQAEPPRRS